MSVDTSATMAAQDPLKVANYDATQIALMEEMCILVDENDVCIGKETKKNCKLIVMQLQIFNYFVRARAFIPRSNYR
jgi:hypothetical protein